MFFSVIYAINLLLVKDPRVHSIIAKLFEFGKDKYILPDFVNPKTGCGIRGEGDSVKVISSFIILLTVGFIHRFTGKAGYFSGSKSGMVC